MAYSVEPILSGDLGLGLFCLGKGSERPFLTIKRSVHLIWSTEYSESNVPISVGLQTPALPPLLSER